jgi:radical SAM superfamily enzyme YgiQ (UPF0313 family)
MLPDGMAVARAVTVSTRAEAVPLVDLRPAPAAKALKVVANRRYVHPGSVIANLTRSDLAGVRVTLVNMPLREAAPPNNAPLGPAILAAVLRDWGALPTILDLNAYRIRDEDAARRALPNGRHLTPEEARGLLERHFARHGDQHLIGLSGKITTLRWQEEIARTCRALQPQALLVSGNGLATEFRTGLFNWIPELDGVAHSEGDDVIVKIAYDAKQLVELGTARAVESGRLDPYLIGEHAGRPRLSYDGGRPADLDAVPFPAYDLLESDVDGHRVMDTYLSHPIWGLAANNSSATPFTMKRSVNTVSSRGCPFACKFCFRGSQGERNYGVRSAPRLVDEIEHFVSAYGVDFVGISDDNFMVQPKRIAELVPLMKHLVHHHGVRWGTHGRLDEAADLRPHPRDKSRFQMADPRRVDLMREAGCVYIGFGAESADPFVLDQMGKGGFILANGTVDIGGHTFPRTMVEGVKNTKASGVHGNCTWIMGYPGENLEHLKTSVAFIKWQEEYYTEGLSPGTEDYEIHRSGVNQRMFTATAYPGTDLFLHPKVQRLLTEGFGISFDASGHPVCDEALHYYVLELDDATKVLKNPRGEPLYYGEMDLDRFLEARDHVNRGETFKILDMH